MPSKPVKIWCLVTISVACTPGHTSAVTIDKKHSEIHPVPSGAPDPLDVLVDLEEEQDYQGFIFYAILSFWYTLTLRHRPLIISPLWLIRDLLLNL